MGVPRIPKRQPSADWHESSWEPEPLQLPLEDTRIRRDRREDDDRGTSDDLPGRHVVVIDLA